MPAVMSRPCGPAVFGSRFSPIPPLIDLNSQMLGDVDTWLMNHCTEQAVL